MSESSSQDSSRNLGDLTLTELWQLFPIILQDHNPEWSTWFAEESAALANVLGSSAVRISHIGSTAVPGLLAKPTVDILVELGGETPANHAAARIRGAGWRQMYGSEVEPLHLGFNKGYTPLGFAEKVFHLHVRRTGDPDELYFRDYLLEHPETCRDYASLKRDLRAQFEHDRDAYTEAKTAFIRGVTAQARQLYGPRYQLAE